MAKLRPSGHATAGFAIDRRAPDYEPMEALEHRFEVMPRSGVAAEAQVVVERSEERTPAALLAVFVLLKHLRLVGPVRFVELLGGGVGPGGGEDLILVHDMSDCQFPVILHQALDLDAVCGAVATSLRTALSPSNRSERQACRL